MKNFIKPSFVCLCCCFCLHGVTQLNNNGAQITIQAGATLYSSGGIDNNTGGVITNEGTIVTDIDLKNNAGATMSGNGIYSVQGNWSNAGTYTAGTSKLSFFGTGNSSITSGGAAIFDLDINKNSNGLVNLQDALTVSNSVNFLISKNWVQLSNNLLTLNNNCVVTGANSKKFFITNGTGLLKKANVGNTLYTFPVGFTKKTYNPIRISEAGVADNYSVRALEHALLNGSSGLAITNGGIDVSWEVVEGVAGGANATIEEEWKTSKDELTGFNSLLCMVVRYKNTAWDFKQASAIPATGTTVKTVSRAGISAFGYFTVLSTDTPTETNSIAGTTKNILPNNTNTASIKIYPTIVKQRIVNITVTNSDKKIQKMNITVIDGNGIRVWQKVNMDFLSQKITLPFLASGVYNMLIEYGTNRFMQKIVVD